MIYIIVEYDLFDYGFLSKENEVVKFRFFDETAITIPMLAREILEKNGFGFKTLKEAKECRATRPVAGKVRFYDTKKKKEIR